MFRVAHNMRSCREPIGADLNHSTISSLAMSRCLGFSLPLRVAVFIGLAIAVRRKIAVQASHIARMNIV